jgi:hypothetical protein
MNWPTGSAPVVLQLVQYPPSPRVMSSQKRALCCDDADRKVAISRRNYTALPEAPSSSTANRRH